jgi:hypothetical protein
MPAVSLSHNFIRLSDGNFKQIVGLAEYEKIRGFWLRQLHSAGRKTAHLEGAFVILFFIVVVCHA